VPALAVPFVINPVLPRFVALHPKVEVEVQVDNRLVDIVAEGFDAGIRLEEFLERDMVHVRLTEPFRFVVVGAASYLQRRGTPDEPKDLLAHDCIRIRSRTTGAMYVWEFERGKKTWRVPVRGPVITSDDLLMITMAEAGVGLAYLPEPAVSARLKRGRLRVGPRAIRPKGAGSLSLLPEPHPGLARVPRFRGYRPGDQTDAFAGGPMIRRKRDPLRWADHR